MKDFPELPDHSDEPEYFEATAGDRTPPELALFHALEDVGAVFPDVAKALDVIEAAFEFYGNMRAGDAMRILTRRLNERGKKGKEIRAALMLLFVDTNMTDEASAAGVTRQTFDTHVQRAHKRIFPDDPPGPT